MSVPGFLEQQLDPRISVGCSGGPTNPGRVLTELPNGKLVQGFNAMLPLHLFEIGYVKRAVADYQTIVDLWYVTNFPGESDGPYTGFRFKYWGDFEATQANSVLTFISGSTWQLGRVHKVATIRFLRPIYKPVASPAVVIYRTRSMSVTEAIATVDYTTGIATISGHTAGDTYTWTGQFDLPVTFADNDWTSSLQVNIEALHVQTPSIRLRELRL